MTAVECWWGEFAGRPQVLTPDADMWAAVEAYTAGASAKEVMAKKEMTRNALYWFMRKHGIPCRKTGPQKSPFQERNQQIIELRKTMTLEAIGERFGMTRERVRQIVARHAPDVARAGKLAVRDARHTETLQRRTRACAACGKPFTAPNKDQRHCSHGCGHASIRIDEQKHRDALAMRAQGWAWNRIGVDVYGSTNSQPGASAQRALLRWARRTGYDLSWLTHTRIRAKKEKR